MLILTAQFYKNMLSPKNYIYSVILILTIRLCKICYC